jgi:hypothetical protein
VRLAEKAKNTYYRKDVDSDVSENGGDKRDRTADLLHAMQALSQLSYTPTSGIIFQYQTFGKKFGGAKRDRTADLLHAMQALSQLSYSPEPKNCRVKRRTA